MRTVLAAAAALATFACVGYLMACPPTSHARTEVAAALSEHGFESWGEIKEKPDEWVVESARGYDSSDRYDVSLAKTDYTVLRTVPNRSYRRSQGRDREHCLF